MEFEEEDDLPTGFPQVWSAIVRHIELWGIRDPAEVKREKARAQYHEHKIEKAAYFKKRRDSLTKEQRDLLNAQNRASYAARKARGEKRKRTPKRKK